MTIERYKITSRDQWMALRAADLTASDVGAAAGADRRKSALQLYAEKTGALFPAADNKMMRRGRWLEPAVIEALHDEHPDWRIIRPGLYLRDPELRLGATPDAVAETGEAGILHNVQCKVVSRPVYERDWSDGPPLPYLLQTLTEGLLLDMPSYIAALVIDTYSAELELFSIERHAAAEQRVKSIASEFWRRVATGNPPAADYARDAETVAALYPESVPEPVLDLSGDNRMAELLPARAMLKNEADGIMQQLLEIDTEIKAKLGDHEVATLPGWRLSWKTHHRKEFVTPASTYRALRVAELQEEIA